MLTTGCASRSAQSTTSRLLTIAALRSSSSCDLAALVEQLQRHLDHADGALHDLLPRRDDGARLLAAQHRRGDLRRVRQVADARLQHLHARLGQPVLHLASAAPRRPRPCCRAGDVTCVLVRVVGIARGQVAQRGLALHVHEVLVVVDLEERLGRVDDLPDDDRGDLDRVAVVVVDLELLALEVADAQRDLPLRVERVRPAQARRLARCRGRRRRTGAPGPRSGSR